MITVICGGNLQSLVLSKFSGLMIQADESLENKSRYLVYK